MDIVQIVGLALAATLIVIVLRQHRPEFAMFVVLLTGLIIVGSLLGKLFTIITSLQSLARRSNVEILHLDTLLKIIGIAYIAEFGSQICRDADENAVAAKVELAAKIIILVMAIPIIVLVLDTLLKLIP